MPPVPLITPANVEVPLISNVPAPSAIEAVADALVREIKDWDLPFKSKTAALLIVSAELALKALSRPSLMVPLLSVVAPV